MNVKKSRSGTGRLITRGLKLFAAATGLCLLAATADAQSEYACSGLEGAATPVFEGETGIFFRVEPDLVSDTRIPQFVVEQIGAISDALASRGTELVVVPLPTKGLVYADEIGPDGDVFGFDPALAELLWKDTHARLGLAGARSLDVLPALRSVSHARPFFATDPRLTNAGIRAIAGALAESADPSNRFPTIRMVASGTVLVPSVAHQQIQSHCIISLPAPETETFDIVSLTSAQDGPRTAIVGSGEMAGEGLATELIFEAALGGQTSHFFSDGRQLDALIRVLASDTYQSSPPETLVWTFPVDTDLARSGVRPFLEAAGLARHGCRDIAPTLFDAAEGRVIVDLKAAASAADIGVMLTLTDGGRDAVFVTFRNEDGVKQSRWISRNDGETSRFLFPLGASTMPDAVSLEFSVPGLLASTPTVAFCGV